MSKASRLVSTITNPSLSSLNSIVAMALNFARWSRNSINSLWSKRTLRVMVEPTPITFDERRSVLHVLQEEGAIEVFKMVPEYPSQFIAVAKADSIADQLYASGTINYSTTTPNSEADISLMDLAKPAVLDSTKATIHKGGEAPAVDNEGNVHKHFSLRILRAEDYDHAGTMDALPTHNQWPESYTRHETFMSSILKQSLPHNMSAKGLARWDYDLADKWDREEGQTGRAIRRTIQKQRREVASWMPRNLKKPLPEEDEVG